MNWTLLNMVDGAAIALACIVLGGGVKRRTVITFLLLALLLSATGTVREIYHAQCSGQKGDAR